MKTIRERLDILNEWTKEFEFTMESASYQEGYKDCLKDIKFSLRMVEVAEKIHFDYSISKVTGDSFKAIGKFRVFIRGEGYTNGMYYGVNSEDATTFGPILETLKKSLIFESPTIDLSPFSDFALANAYYGYHYNDEKSGIGHEISAWYPVDSAFDDGSHILQINTENSVRLIGFKVGEDRKVIDTSVRSVDLTREELTDIVIEFKNEVEYTINVDTK